MLVALIGLIEEIVQLRMLVEQSAIEGGCDDRSMLLEDWYSGLNDLDLLWGQRHLHKLELGNCRIQYFTRLPSSLRSYIVQDHDGR